MIYNIAKILATETL